MPPKKAFWPNGYTKKDLKNLYLIMYLMICQTNILGT